VVVCFCLRLGLSSLLRKPPVETGALRGEVDDARDCASEASVCAGDTPLDCSVGGWSTGARGSDTLDAGATAGFSTTFFRGCALRVVTLGEGGRGNRLPTCNLLGSNRLGLRGLHNRRRRYFLRPYR
jgi:hypothetical protein